MFSLPPFSQITPSFTFAQVLSLFLKGSKVVKRSRVSNSIDSHLGLEDLSSNIAISNFFVMLSKGKWYGIAVSMLAYGPEDLGSNSGLL